MTTKCFIFMIPLFSLAVPIRVQAQCSDAGVCVMGSHGHAGGYTIDANYVFGYSGKDDDLTFNTVELGGQISIFEKSRIDVLLPWSGISGPLGTTSGLGDLIVVWNQEIPGLKESSLTASIGGRFATGDVNSGNLPQAYQPGLGTNDLLLGVMYETGSWDIGLGYQLSKARSENTVTRLKRGDDFLARVGYGMSIGDAEVRLQALVIKRLDESSVRDLTVTTGEVFVDVPDSDQLQVNILATAFLPLSEAFGLQGFVAIPLLSREVNVDGLTRNITLSLGAQITL